MIINIKKLLRKIFQKKGFSTNKNFEVILVSDSLNNFKKIFILFIVFFSIFSFFFNSNVVYAQNLGDYVEDGILIYKASEYSGTIAQYSDSGDMSWYSASALQDGYWRLPIGWELAGGISNAGLSYGYYWTFEEAWSAVAYMYHPGTGSSVGDNKTNYHSVRLVRDNVSIAPTPTYTVTGSATAGGSISPSSQSVTQGGTTTLSVTPDYGYSSSASGCGGYLSGSTYYTGGIYSNCTVSVSFAAITSTITVSSGAGGSISPGTQAWSYDTSQYFWVTPNTGYHVVNVVVDGVSQGAVGGYPFYYIKTTHSISATFAPDDCTGTPWGTMSSGTSNTAYSSATPAYSTTCSSISQSRTCTAGSLSGSYTTTSCTQGCASGGGFPSGAYGDTVTGWISNSAVYPTTCSSATRTCTGGSSSAFSAWNNTSYSAPSGCSQYYTASFNSNGGTPSYSSTNYTAGASVTSPGSPTRSGYTFTGWSAALPSAMPSANTTYTAQWSANSCTVAPFGTIASGSSTYAWSQNAPNYPTTCTSVRESRTCTAGTLSGSNIYNICYEGCNAPWGATWNGQSRTMYSEATPTTSCASISQTRTCLDGTVNGSYTSLSCSEPCTGTPWGTMRSGTANTAYVGSTADVCSSQSRSCANGSLSGSYTATSCTVNSYSITFNSAGGTAVNTITQNYGTSVSAPANPTRTGYTFAGWSPALAGTMPSGGQSLTATWTANSYGVTWNANTGGTSSGVATCTYNTTVTPTCTPSSGYSTASCSAFTCSTSNSFTPSFSPNSYSITFNSAGGTAVTTITQNYGTTVSAPASPTRTGYVFTGWSPALAGTMPVGGQALTATWSDTAAPSAPGIPTASWTGDHYINTSVTVSTSGASDNGSGMRGYRLCRSNDNAGGCSVWTANGEHAGLSEVVSGADLPSAGTYRYYYWYAYDNAGNQSSNSTAEYIRMDGAAPSTPGAMTTSWAGDHYVNTSFVAATTGSSDAGTGVSYYNLCMSADNGGSTSCATWVATGIGSSYTVSGSNLPSNGTYRYYTWYAYDAFGNQSGQSTGTYIRMDSTAPTFSSKTTYSGWYTANQTSTFAYTDSNSGVNSGNNQTCTISAEGSAQTCTLSAASNVCDVAGNCVSPNGQVSNGANIDKTAPYYSSKTTYSGWYGSNQTSTFTYADATSGVASGNNQTCTISAEGSAQTCTVAAASNVCDTAGNCLNPNGAVSNSANIDKTAPYLSSKTTYSGWYGANQTSTFVYADAVSGVASGNNQSCTISAEGSAQTCTMGGASNVCDTAGNCTSPNGQVSNGANIDKTAPTITDISATSAVKGTTVRFYVSASDGGSGLNTGNAVFYLGTYPYSSWNIVSGGTMSWNGSQYYYDVVLSQTYGQTYRAYSYVYDALSNQAARDENPTEFSILNTPPPYTTPISPANTGTLTGNGTSNVTFTTTSVTDADGQTVQYYFRVTTGSDAETGVVCNSGWQTGLTYTCAPGYGTFYWHVYTYDGIVNPAPNHVWSFTMNKASQAALTTTAQSVTYPTGFTALATTGGSGGGAVTYAVTTAGAGCSISGTTLSYTSAGTCGVTATKAADANYNAVSSAAATFTINKSSQAALSITNTTGTYGSGLTIGTSGGSGSGAVTYSLDSLGTAGCSVGVSTGVVTFTSAGTCTVTATKASDTNYNSIFSSSTTITINKATQGALSISTTAVTYPNTLSLATTGGGGSGVVTYVVNSGSCTVAGATLTPTGSGSCSVTATKAADTNYLVVSSTATTITITAGTQAALTLTSTTGTYPTSVSLTTSGGSGSGAVSYVASNGTATGCTATGSTLSFTSAGTCSVTATKASDVGYNAISSSATTVTISKGNQATLTFGAQTVTYPATFAAMSTTGGSGGGAVTYAVTTAGTAGCSVAGTTLSYTNAGTCGVTATKATDSGYNVVSSTEATFTINKATQGALTLTNTTGTYGSALTVSSSGGTGTGAVTYSIGSAGTAGCSVGSSTGVVAFTGAGTCTISATKAADVNYLVVSSIATTVTINGTAPLLSLPTSSSINTSGVTLGATMTSNGGLSISARGTCYGTTATPSTNCVAEGGTGIGAFTHIRTGLTPNTTYYYRGYATNSIGTTYSTDGSFTTFALPTLTTGTATSVTISSATLGANVISLGNPSSISERGICYGLTEFPTNCVASTGTSTGSYTLDVSSLTRCTLYYYRGYANNITSGIGYSIGNTFTTSCAVLPILNTQIVNNVTTSSGVVTGEIVHNGYEANDVRGVVYDTLSHGTPGNVPPSSTPYPNKVEETGSFPSGTFNATITGLSENKVYNARAYSHNSIGYSYSKEVFFKTGTSSSRSGSVSNIESILTPNAIQTGGNRGGGTHVEAPVIPSAPVNNGGNKGGGVNDDLGFFFNVLYKIFNFSSFKDSLLGSVILSIGN